MRFIGSKRNLLSEIKQMLDKHVYGNEQTFLDLFAGTNVVSKFFKRYYTIYTNDILYFSYVNSKALIENNYPLNFDGLKRLNINNPVKYLTCLSENIPNNKIGYYEENYSPAGNSMYLSQKNAKRIDAIRDMLDTWRENKNVTEYEYFYLLNSLIESIPFVSNITGTYGAFLKHWDKRALNDLSLEMADIINNDRENKSFNEDSNKLVKRISSDITYIDIPYNTRQYAPNYHLLENVARNNHPQLNGLTKMFDWGDLKSKYSNKKEALNSLEELISNLDTTHLIFSYNNEGIIKEDDLIKLFNRYSIDGTVDINRIPYRKYKSKTIYDPNKTFYEMLFYIKRKESPNINFIKKNIKPQVINNKKYIKSPVNYIGSKYRLLNQIIPLFPEKINTFVDIFSGGANMGINVRANKYIFNDMNTLINEMFRFFQKSDPITLVNEIKKRINEFQLTKTNEEAFINFRKLYNSNPNPIDLYILSCYSYNYQFRFNNRHEFNNPFGRNRSHFSINMENNLLSFVTRLQSINAVFTDLLFDKFDIDKLTVVDFVYLDPPYLITNGSYNDGNRGFVDWGIDQELLMYKFIKDLVRKNIKFALSNVLEHKGKKNEMLIKFTEENNFRINYLECSYKNSSYNTKKQESIEVLITNY